MAVLVVGSTAFDTVETPFGREQDCLGGSATHFSLAARLFTEVQLVSVVGEDFPDQSRQLLLDQEIDLSGLEVQQGATFRWSGKYSTDMNSRETLDVQLNTFGNFKPQVPPALRTTPYVFLANGAPKTQASVLDQMESTAFVVADTMDLWIETTREDLDEQKGEHGSFLFSNYFQYALPAYPTDNVLDPTGAGDSFAGGFMGFLAECDSLSLWNMKRAMAYGTVTASLTVEGFGVQQIVQSQRNHVERRYQELIQFVSL
ncbi:MAG: PfkB family carbohydrate kinase [Planctomycetota bacterium]|jgi:sugar/nucleoside kinase (ribokinase family)